MCNKTDTDRITFYKLADEYLYFLSLNELLAIDISEKKQIRLHFVATLEQVEEKVLEMQIGTWQNIIVIVLRFSRSVHVYLTPKDFRSTANISPYQKIKTNGPGDRILLFNNNLNLFLIMQGITKANINELR